MNLIENLGGYERAKKELMDALLEYRRQHNIFEVGDKVVYAKKYKCLTIKLIKFKNLYLNYFAIKINMYTLMYTANKSPLMRAFAFR